MEITTRHQPFIYPIFSLIAGIFWQQLYPYNNATILVTVISISVLLIILFIKKFDLEIIQIFSYFLLFFSGTLLLQAQKNHHQELFKNLGKTKVDIIALIKDKEKIVDKKFKEITKIHVQKIKEINQKEYTATNFNLLCYTSTTTKANINDLVEIKKLTLNTPQTIQQDFKFVTFNDYLIKENILTTIFVYKLFCKSIDSPEYSFTRWIINKRNHILQRLKNKLSSKTFCYFSSIFLGHKKNQNMCELRETFNYWGISHHLARAGLHISLFILIWKFLLSLLPLGIYLKQIFLILICLIYQQLSWSSIPFVRAFYIFLLYEIGKILKQQTNFLHLLSCICLTILLFNPIQILFLDFQLSFALTFALGWLGYANRIQNINLN